MNRKWFWLLEIVCVLLVFEACASQVIFDKNLPLEESTHMFIYYGLEIKEYNGISVPQKKVLLSTYSTWHDVYLPPGEMEFMANVFIKYGNVVYTASDVLFRYTFDAGKYYTLVFTDYGGPDSDQWGVNIFDSPPPSIGYPKKENLIAFTPFYRLENR
jgi:hypothetical protein